MHKQERNAVGIKIKKAQKFRIQRKILTASFTPHPTQFRYYRKLIRQTPKHYNYNYWHWADRYFARNSCRLLWAPSSTRGRPIIVLFYLKLIPWAFGNWQFRTDGLCYGSTLRIREDCIVLLMLD